MFTLQYVVSICWRYPKNILKLNSHKEVTFSVTLLLLFIYKPHRHPFTPAKLSAVVDEAKIHAAEHALQTLGLQTESTDAAAAFPGM